MSLENLFHFAWKAAPAALLVMSCGPQDTTAPELGGSSNVDVCVEVASQRIFIDPPQVWQQSVCGSIVNAFLWPERPGVIAVVPENPLNQNCGSLPSRDVQMNCCWAEILPNYPDGTNNMRLNTFILLPNTNPTYPSVYFTGDSTYKNDSSAVAIINCALRRYGLMSQTP